MNKNITIDKDGQLGGSAVAQLDRTIRGVDGTLCLDFCEKIVDALKADGITAEVAVYYDEDKSDATSSPWYTIGVLVIEEAYSMSITDETVASMEYSALPFVTGLLPAIKEAVKNER